MTQTSNFDPAKDLSEFSVGLGFGDIPPDVVELLKQRVLDTLACAIAGSSVAPIQTLREHVDAYKGTAQSRVWVFGEALPAPMAAFVNGPMARALDLGDTHPEGQHLSEYILPSLLAVAEARQGVSGRELLAALCVGGEVQARIGNACFGVSEMARYGRTSNYTQWGAVVGAARLIGCDPDQTWNAMGIGFSVLGSADFQSTAEDNHIVRLKHAFACANAIHCAELAKRGVTGTRNIFLGSRGFLETYYGLKNDPAELTRGLGTQWEWLQTMTKGYACCYGSHASITGITQLMDTHGLRPEDIMSIDCGLHAAPHALVANPAAKKWNPLTPVEAQFSLPYSIACVAIHGRLMAEELTPAAIAREDVRAFMHKVKVHLLEDDLDTFASTVSVTTRDGRTLDLTVHHPKGSPGNPLGWPGETDKFRACAASSARAFSDSRIEKVIDLCRHLDSVDDVRELVDAICPV